VVGDEDGLTSSAATVAARNPENAVPPQYHLLRPQDQVEADEEEITAGSVWRTCASHQ
jgi:hypothetical protein